MAELVLTVEVAAPPETTFAAATDWPRQGEWMIGTRVRATRGDGVGIGARIEAFTGVGGVGFTDPMEIVHWQPPYRCVMRHLGRVVRGAGAFEVEARPGGTSRFVWSEWLLPPGGLAGQYAFLLGRPAFAAGVARSLRRFARLVEAERRAGTTAG
jgi:uncharacterized protein YndB with AHSA1/START domain